MVDTDGTMRSIPEPFGAAVRDEAVAVKWIKGGSYGYRRDYTKLIIADEPICAQYDWAKKTGMCIKSYNHRDEHEFVNYDEPKE